jgi:hypothetical protein
MADEDRLPTALWVDAHLRLLTLQAKPYYIVNKGAYASGTVMLKINTLTEGCRVLQQQRNFDGVLGWMQLFKGKKVPEAEADAYLRKAVDRDPDVWVIEIEDREGINPFDGPMI